MRDPSLRRERLREAIRETLSELLFKEMKDPRLHGVVISAVDLSRDMKLARAYYSVIGDAERERQAQDGLDQAKGMMRREMGRTMRLHSAPSLEFRRDKGFERADRISRILDGIVIPPAEPDSDEDGDV